MALAQQLIEALTHSGAEKMCLTVNPSNGYQQAMPMQVTIQLLNSDGSVFDNNKRRRDAPEEEVPAGKRARKGSKVPRRKTKVLDQAATLAKYRARVSAMPAEAFAEMRGAILTDYKLHECSPTDAVHKTHAFVLGEIARSKGFVPVGFVSSNKKDKKYIESLPNGLLRPDEGGDAKIVYVGDKNQFTQQEASKWAIQKDDRVFVPVDAAAAATSSSSEDSASSASTSTKA